MVGEEDRVAALARPETHGSHAVRERPVNLGMGLLIGPRRDADFLDMAVRRRSLAELEICRMRLHQILRRERPVFSLVAEHIVGPRGLYDLYPLLENLAIYLILLIPPLGKVGRPRTCSRHRRLGLKPPRLVAARDAHA